MSTAVTPDSALRRGARRGAARTASYRDAPTDESDADGALPVVRAPRGTKRKLAGAEDDEYGLGVLRGTAPGPAAEDDGESDLTVPEDSDDASPARKRKSPKKKARKAAAAGAEEDELAEEAEEGESPKKKRTPRKRKDVAALDGESPEKPRRARPLKPEPVYVIPDVEKKTTTFKGRLGYACLNTILRNRKPADQAVFCSRTCRIDSIKKNGVDWMKELGRQNIKDLVKLIEWNEANNIRFMRLSSEMFPFASHPEYGYSLEYCAVELAAAGALANKYGHRLTTHPGQFTQLGSPKPGVVTNAVRDLRYHCEMLDRMGMGKDSVMIIHGGGMYGDKAAALARIRESFTTLLPQNVKDRLVLENDEMCYSAEDLLPLCEELQIPLVFDYHHDWILPSSIGRVEIIRRANAIFAAKGIKPKQHLSEPRPGAVTVMERRAHADRCQTLPDELPDDMDLMIEAKDKEQAVLHLARIYDLYPVAHASLRPPAAVETKETKGRKSTGRKRAADAGVVADEEALKGEDPPVPVDEDADADAEASPAKRRRTRKPKAEPDAADAVKAEEHDAAALLAAAAAAPSPAEARTPRRSKAAVKAEPDEDAEMADAAPERPTPSRRASARKAKSVVH